MSHIENPTAYWNAVDSRIKCRASMKRRREFEEKHPAALAILADLWWPETKPCCDQRELDEWSECRSCGSTGGSMDWQRDGSHLVLKTMTVAERTALLKRTGWLREGFDKYDSLTDKQVVKLQEILEETRGRVSEWAKAEEERVANAIPWEAGRQEFDCMIVSAKIKEVPGYSYYDSTTLSWKATYERPDGSRVWSTIPSKLLEQVADHHDLNSYDEDSMAPLLRGLRIVLRCNVEPKQGEPTFAFGKRPHLVSFIHDITGEALEALAATTEED